MWGYGNGSWQFEDDGSTTQVFSSQTGDGTCTYGTGLTSSGVTTVDGVEVPARVTGTSIQAVILQGGGKDIDFGPIFGAVFWTATISSAIGLIFMIFMKELPLRSHAAPAVEPG